MSVIAFTFITALPNKLNPLSFSHEETENRTVCLGSHSVNTEINSHCICLIPELYHMATFEAWEEHKVFARLHPG